MGRTDHKHDFGVMMKRYLAKRGKEGLSRGRERWAQKPWNRDTFWHAQLQWEIMQLEQREGTGQWQNIRVDGTGANFCLLLLYWVTQKPLDSLERGWGNSFKVIHVCKETTDRDSREGTNGHMEGFCIRWRAFHARWSIRMLRYA